MARTPKYKSPEEMQEKIDAYFEDCKGHPFIGDDGCAVLDKYGQPIILDAHPPTVTGLALALGFTSRQALMNYQGRKDFFDSVRRARSRIEEYAESRLFDRDGQRGAEFSLRYNFKWAQEEEKEETESAGVVMLPVVIEKEE